MIYQVSVAGRTYAVELTRSGSGWLCRVDGRELPLDAVSLRDGVLSILLEGKSYEVKQERVASEANIVVGNERFPVVVIDPRAYRSRARANSSGQGVKKVIAPMPGKVVRILASPGAAVESGQGIIVIEAMKMQNELKAPKSGKLIKVTASEGAPVEAGQVLAEIE